MAAALAYILVDETESALPVMYVAVEAEVTHRFDRRRGHKLGLEVERVRRS